jgi:siroheme synthase
VSLTRRGVSRNVAFVTPRIGSVEQESDRASAVRHADSAAVYMGAGRAGRRLAEGRAGIEGRRSARA